MLFPSSFLHTCCHPGGGGQRKGVLETTAVTYSSSGTGTDCRLFCQRLCHHTRNCFAWSRSVISSACVRRSEMFKEKTPPPETHNKEQQNNAPLLLPESRCLIVRDSQKQSVRNLSIFRENILYATLSQRDLSNNKTSQNSTPVICRKDSSACVSWRKELVVNARLLVVDAS